MSIPLANLELLTQVQAAPGQTLAEIYRETTSPDGLVLVLFPPPGVPSPPLGILMRRTQMAELALALAMAADSMVAIPAGTH